MSRKEWTVLAVVLGAIVTFQVVGHDGAHEGHDAGHALEAERRPQPAAATPAEETEQGPFRTVALEVRGMT